MHLQVEVNAKTLKNENKVLGAYSYLNAPYKITFCEHPEFNARATDIF